MLVQFWDASGLAKRYAFELGSDSADALFEMVPKPLQLTTSITYAEVYSVLIRKLNRKEISKQIFESAKSNIRLELIDDPKFVLLSIPDDVIYSGIPLMEAYNINTTDAALIRVFQSYMSSFAARSDVSFFLVASDKNLLRAAEALGIKTANPQTLAASDVPAFLASL